MKTSPLVRLAGLVLGTLALVLAAAWLIRNPERATLDDAARAAAPGKFVATRVGLTHYEQAGPDTGRVAVLVHGFSVPAYIWDSTYHALADSGYRVIRYDLVGRGWSDRPDIAYAPEDFDAQLVDLLDSLRVTGPVDLFGLSFGGLVTAYFTAEHPERVRSLLLVDPVTRAGQLPAMFRTRFVGPVLWQLLAVPAMPAGQPTDFLHPERWPDWEDKYRPQMRYRGFGRALRRSRWEGQHVDFPALHTRVAQTGKPVFLAWGKQDATVPIALADDLRQRIPQLEFVPIDSAGHLPNIEQAAVFNAAMFGFLGRHR